RDPGEGNEVDEPARGPGDPAEPRRATRRRGQADEVEPGGPRRPAQGAALVDGQVGDDEAGHPGLGEVPCRRLEPAAVEGVEVAHDEDGRLDPAGNLGEDGEETAEAHPPLERPRPRTL